MQLFATARCCFPGARVRASSVHASQPLASKSFRPRATRRPASCARGLQVVCDEKFVRIVIVRHGQSTWNAEGRIQGSTDDSVLTTKGVSQAYTSKEMLKNGKFDKLYRSPLRRATQTADIIWDGRPGEKISLDDMREIDLYSFERLLKAEGKAKFGEEYTKWQKDSSNFCIDGHYPVRELWERGAICYQQILKDATAEKTVALVVAHNAINQAMVAAALGLPSTYFRKLLQSNCGLTVLDAFVEDYDVDSNGNIPGDKVSLYLDRLNETPGPPFGKDSTSAGRKAEVQVIMLYHGEAEGEEGSFSLFNTPENPGLSENGSTQIFSTASLLLDIEVPFSDQCNPSAAAEPCAPGLSVELLSSVLDLSEGDITYSETFDDTVRAVPGIDVDEEALSSPTMTVATMKPSKAINFLNVDAQLQNEIDALWLKAKHAWDELKQIERRAAASGAGGGSLLVVGGEDVLSAMIAVEIGLEPTAKNAGVFRLRKVRDDHAYRWTQKS
eukprot:scaffold527_cov368-Prasinococcus_capsulatus_cf.AAC.25